MARIRVGVRCVQCVCVTSRWLEWLYWRWTSRGRRFPCFHSTATTTTTYNFSYYVCVRIFEF